MKLLIVSIIAFIVGTLLFNQWLVLQPVIAESCWHEDIVFATKVPLTTFNGKNEVGEDVSCYIDFELNGYNYRQEQWNVGKCDGGIIQVSVIDYTCH